VATKEENKNSKDNITGKSPCDVTCIVGDQEIKGISTQFSERGILILCKKPAPLNAKVKLELNFPGIRNTVELTGEVVWTNIYGSGDSLSPKGMGVKFINMEREQERLLAEIAGHYECQTSVYSCYYT